MKAPTTIQTRYTVNFCEPRRWEKVSSLERDMNHNTTIKGRRPNRDDEINKRPVNKKISHIACTIFDWNNACILSNPFSKWIQLEWMPIYLIQSSFLPCRFPTFQEPYNLTDFLGSLEKEMHHHSQRHQMMAKERKPGWIHFILDNTSYFLGDCFHFGLQRIDWITS